MAVYRHLSDFILNGYFQPGEWIRERQVKELLGVSSTPIREALSMLVKERILESIPHHGVRVKDLTLQEIEEVYELRAELEGFAAELAAKRGSSAQLRKMEELLREAEEKREENFKKHGIESLISNNQFHDLIAEASGNRALKDALFQLHSGINLIRMMSWKRNTARSFMTLEQHGLILEAIMAGDGKLARLRMEEHVWDTVKLVLESAKKRNDPLF